MHTAHGQQGPGDTADVTGFTGGPGVPGIVLEIEQSHLIRRHFQKLRQGLL